MSEMRLGCLKRKIYLKQRRLDLKSKGLCQWCGKADAIRKPDGSVGCRCPTCAKKASNRSSAILKRHREGWVKLGICVICGKNQVMQNRKWCGFCAERNTEVKQRAKRARRNSNLLLLQAE